MGRNDPPYGLFLLPLGAVGYCSLPLTWVAILTVTLSDQTGREIQADAAAKRAYLV